MLLELCLLLVQGSLSDGVTTVQAPVGDLSNFGMVDLARKLKNLLDLVGGQCVKRPPQPNQQLNESRSLGTQQSELHDTDVKRCTSTGQRCGIGRL